MNLRKIGVVFLAVFIFACRFLQAREKSDVIVMKNGDKISCEVKGLSSNTLYISVDYILNTISVDWTKVDHIDSKTIVSGPNTKRRRLYRGAREPETPDRRPLELAVWEGSEKMVTLKRGEVILWGKLNWNFTCYANWDN